MPRDLSVARPRTVRFWRFCLVLLGAIWIGWYFWQGSLNAAMADVPSQDLPHAWQAVWNAAHGHGFRYTDLILEQNVPRLAAHADFLLLALAPIVRLWPDYAALLLFQAVGVATGAWALWRITRRVTNSEGAAGLLAVSYLLYGPLQFAVTFQFHGVLLALPALLWSAEAVLYRRRWWIAAVWFAVALMAKEQVGFIAGPLLWWLEWRYGSKRLAWWYLALGWAFSLVLFLVVIPSARPVGGPHLFWQFYYGTLGATPGEILPRLLQPAELGHRLLTAQHAQDAILLLVPVGFLALIDPLVLLAAVALLPHWLADYFAIYSLYYQNHVLALAPLFLAAVFGLARVRRWRGFPRWRWLLAGGFVLAVAIGSVAFSPNPWSLKYLPVFRQGDPRIPAMKAIDKKIPASATVAVAWGLPPVFRDHPTVWTLPAGYAQAEYVVVGASALAVFREYAPTYPDELFQYFDHSPAFTAVVRTGEMGLYRRRPEVVPTPLAATIHDPTLHGLWNR